MVELQMAGQAAAGKPIITLLHAWVAGRGGATIREITKASRARVDVHRNYELETGGANQGQQQQQLQQQQHAHNGGVSALSNNAINSEKVISIYGKEGDSISTACKKILEVRLNIAR